MWKWLSWIKIPTKFSGKYPQKRKPPTDLSFEYRNRKFYVIFDTARFWFSPLLKKGFAHCYAIEQLDCIYMMFDPTRHGLNVTMPNCGVEHPLIENILSLKPSLKIVEILTYGNHKALVFAPKLLTCVSALEYIMGVSFGMFGALTPYRLYTSLIKANHPNIISVRELCHSVEESQERQSKEHSRVPDWTGRQDLKQKGGSKESERKLNSCSSDS